MRIFMSILTGLVVFAVTGGALMVYFIMTIFSAAKSNPPPPDSFTTYFTIICAAFIAVFAYLAYLSARGVFRHYDRRIIGAMTIGNFLAAVLLTPFVLSGVSYLGFGFEGMIIVGATFAILAAVILILFGIWVMLVKSDVPQEPSVPPDQADS